MHQTRTKSLIHPFVTLFHFKKSLLENKGKFSLMSSYKGFQQTVSSELIKLAQKGDMKALEEIYSTYSDACYNLALRISGQPNMAQDILQDSFLKIINKISKFRSEGSFAGWIRQIVAREAIDHIKKGQRFQLVGDQEVLPAETPDLLSSQWMDVCRDLDTLTSKLSSTTRAVLFLHEVEGYNHAEIGRMFKKSESFSKVTLNRAYKALRKMTLKQEAAHAFK